ncbi:MAG: hypothetical protein Q7S73_02320 [bacterium]|nr:hypothetical protein [bacterium]
MEIKKDSDRYFRSSSFPLAVFLFARGEQIAGINHTDNPNKKEFAFVHTDRLNELCEIYKFGKDEDVELLVPIRLVEQARRQLLDRLNDA